MPWAPSGGVNLSGNVVRLNPEGMCAKQRVYIAQTPIMQGNVMPKQQKSGYTKACARQVPAIAPREREEGAGVPDEESGCTRINVKIIRREREDKHASSLVNRDHLDRPGRLLRWRQSLGRRRLGVPLCIASASAVVTEMLLMEGRAHQSTPWRCGRASCGPL